METSAEKDFDVDTIDDKDSGKIVKKKRLLGHVNNEEFSNLEFKEIDLKFCIDRLKKNLVTLDKGQLANLLKTIESHNSNEMVRLGRECKMVATLIKLKNILSRLEEAKMKEVYTLSVEIEKVNKKETNMRNKLINTKTAWNSLMVEMREMHTDFVQEKRWKIFTAANIAYNIKNGKNEAKTIENEKIVTVINNSKELLENIVTSNNNSYETCLKRADSCSGFSRLYSLDSNTSGLVSEMFDYVLLEQNKLLNRPLIIEAEITTHIAEAKTIEQTPSINHIEQLNDLLLNSNAQSNNLVFGDEGDAYLVKLMHAFSHNVSLVRDIFNYYKTDNESPPSSLQIYRRYKELQELPSKPNYKSPKPQLHRNNPIKGIEELIRKATKQREAYNKQNNFVSKTNNSRNSSALLSNEKNSNKSDSPSVQPSNSISKVYNASELSHFKAMQDKRRIQNIIEQRAMQVYQNNVMGNRNIVNIQSQVAAHLSGQVYQRPLNNLSQSNSPDRRNMLQFNQVSSTPNRQHSNSNRIALNTGSNSPMIIQNNYNQRSPMQSHNSTRVHNASSPHNSTNITNYPSQPSPTGSIHNARPLQQSFRQVSSASNNVHQCTNSPLLAPSYNSRNGSSDVAQSISVYDQNVSSSSINTKQNTAQSEMFNQYKPSSSLDQNNQHIGNHKPAKPRGRARGRRGRPRQS